MMIFKCDLIFMSIHHRTFSALDGNHGLVSTLTIHQVEGLSKVLRAKAGNFLLRNLLRRSR